MKKADSMPIELVLAGAAFAAGVLNTIAGGGTFLTFPALVYAGVPVVSANATSALAVFPGYLGAVGGFRKEIGEFDRSRLISLAIYTAIGGLLGALLLMVSSNQFFSMIVPFLLALATIIFAFGSRIRRILSKHSNDESPGPIGIFLVSVYGGYFNGGLGIVLLALFSLWGMRDLNLMNGLKNAASFIISAISVATFAAAGIVAWEHAIIMMIASAIGGYMGAPLARVLPVAAVRIVIIGIGTILTVVFFYKAFLASS